MLCRLCLTEYKENGKQLFVAKDVNGSESNILAILSLLDLELTLDDALSITICTECWQRIHYFEKFCMYIKDQQTNFADEISYVLKLECETEEIQMTKPSDAYEDSAIDIKDEIAPIEMEVSSVYQQEREVMLDEAVANTEVKEVEVQNEATEENDLSESESSQTKSSENKPKRIWKKIKLEEHLGKPLKAIRLCEAYLVKNGQLNCELCEATFVNYETNQTHYCVEHNCLRYIKCCGKEFKTSFTLFDHVLKHLNPTHECELCKKKFAFKKNLDNHHHVVHSQTGNFKCGICKKKFEFIKSLGIHLRVVHPKPEDLKYKCCYECNKAFADKYSFKRHLDIHKAQADGAKFPCPICNKLFTVKSYINIHLITHFKTKQYNCEICDYQYKTAYKLLEHMETHSEVYFKEWKQSILNPTKKCVVIKANTAKNIVLNIE